MGAFKTTYYSSGDVHSFLMLTGKSFLGSASKRFVECICECGKIWFAGYPEVKSGRTKSCGCKRGLLVSNGSKTHGESKTTLYKAWMNMKTRCSNEMATGYENYGGKGVVVCDEWVDDFTAFQRWAIENGWGIGLKIDKDIIPKKLGIPALIYSPDMCCIVTNKENNRSRTDNVLVTAFGETKCVAEWVESDICSVSAQTISYRINKLGWTPELAITTKSKKKKSG